MALPANKIKKVKLPNNTEYEIIPSSLQDGTTNYVLTTPTLSEDDTIVTCGGDQSISGVKTIEYSLQFKNSFYNTIWRIFTNGGDGLTIQKDGSYGGISIQNNSMTTGSLYPSTSNTCNLGSSDYKWKNLYLSGYITDGIKSILVTDIAALYDFETETSKNQSTSVVVGNAVTNINGRVFQNYTATLVTAGGYTFYQIYKNGSNPTEYEAKEYMKYMTGSTFLPTYNYDFPKQTIFTFADRSTWKPQYSSTDGLRLYRLTTPVALESQIPNNIINGTTTGSLEQKHDGSSFTFVNPNSPLNNTSVSIGIATGTYATMLGGKGRVEGKRGFVNGTQVVATGNYSHAEGNNTHASGANAHAEGIQTYASASASHAEGSSTAATETGAHSEGYGTHADGVYTHAEGSTNYALGDNSHAEGGSNIIGVYSGPSPTPGPAPDPGTAVHSEGMGSHAEGNNNTITGSYSHAEGQGNTISSNRAHAEGNGNTVSGLYAHAEGNSGVASGEGAHSEGLYGHAVGNYSHAEGAATYANGLYSHAQGQNSTANGTASFASGFHATANRDYQTVVGKYNLGQNDTLFEVGNGTSDNARSNAFEVYTDGYAKLGGKFVATTNQLPTVNNGTLTIQKNGSSIATFSANQSGNATANITVPTKTSDLTNDSGFLTSESDTLSTVLNRGNSASKDIDLNYHDFFNAGVQKTAYNYSTSQEPNTQYWWYQIVPPGSSSQSDRYLICVEGDENYPRGRGTFILDVSKYSTNSYNVSLNNIGSTMWGSTHLLNCAIDSSGNVYIQANAAWSSYLRFIRHNSNATTQSYTQVGKAAFGTVSGFTSLKMITDCGTIRLYNGAIDTSTSNSGFTTVDAEKFRENGTYLENKYYLASNPSGYTSNAGTVTSVRVQAGTGLSSSQSTAQTSTLNTTISIANGYKLPTNTQWNTCIKDVSLSGTTLTFTKNDNSTIVINLPSGGQSSGGDPNIY